MLKIVKNLGQCAAVGEGKYLLQNHFKEFGTLYAPLGIRPIVGLIKYYLGVWR